MVIAMLGPIVHIHLNLYKARTAAEKLTPICSTRYYLPLDFDDDKSRGEEITVNKREKCRAEPDHKLGLPAKIKAHCSVDT